MSGFRDVHCEKKKSKFASRQFQLPMALVKAKGSGFCSFSAEGSNFCSFSRSLWRIFGKGFDFCMFSRTLWAEPDLVQDESWPMGVPRELLVSRQNGSFSNFEKLRGEAP